MYRPGDALVVSPSEVARTIASAALVAWGDAKVRGAGSRQEALRILSGHTPGLVLIDCDMPDAMVVAAACFNAAVPFVTFNDDDRSAADGGARACVSRPLNGARLIDALDVAVGTGSRA